MSSVPASRRVRELALWAGAAAGLVAIAAGVAVALGGFSFLVFRSGSMSPDIETGALAVSREVDAADLRPGDVVSVVAANGERVTHRVVTSTLRGERASLVLKGDANDAADNEVYVVDSAERVVASVPYGGYVVSRALTPPGLVALASVSLMLIVLTGGRQSQDAAPQGPRGPARHRAGRSHLRRSVAGGALLAVVAGSGAAAAHTSGTWATYTDRAVATTGAFTASTVAPPASITCDAASASIRWTAPVSGTPSGYRMSWSYNGGSGTVDFAAGVLSGRPPGPGLFGNRSYTVTIVALYGTWLSAPTAAETIRGQNFLGTTWTC